jgi:hypothetical protein
MEVSQNTISVLFQGEHFPIGSPADQRGNCSACNPSIKQCIQDLLPSAEAPRRCLIMRCDSMCKAWTARLPMGFLDE